ncbi:MAG: galactokinase [Eubacterium sp.]|nr:galactokinase [Eubacterium sp.]
MNTQELIDYISNNKLNERLFDIYQDEEKIEYQKERYISAIKNFIELYGDNDIEIYSAPGRTEVGGNHTDHQHGQVLAASISVDAIAITSKNYSGMINIKSEGYDMINVNVADAEKTDSEEGTTAALIRGIVAGMQARDFKTGGFNAYITSDVLGGSGLSSSAAFETIIGNILSGLYNDNKIDAVTIAILGQYAENVYFGKPCGLMDQMACSVGSLCHIDFADTENPQIEKIDLDLNAVGYSLCITDTKGSHADLTPDYAAVPAEMKSVAEMYDKNVLMELSEEEVISHIPEIRKKLGDRAVLRALHFYEECKRVENQVNAIKSGDFEMFLKNIKASGDSSYKFLQNVYTSHDIMHQNVSIALCMSEIVLGSEYGVSRVHGGGFAGTIQAFVKNEKVSEYKQALDNIFGEGSCNVLKIRKYGGIKVI